MRAHGHIHARHEANEKAAADRRQSFEEWWDRWSKQQKATLTEYDFKVAEASWMACEAAKAMPANV